MLTLSALQAPNGADNSQRRFIIEVTGVVSGNYTEGGEPIHWTSLANAPGGSVLVNSINPNNPLWVEAHMGIPSANGPIYIPVLYNYATNALQIYVSSTGDELAAGAYSASYTGATFYIKAEFQL